jgi:hypothetical protein
MLFEPTATNITKRYFVDRDGVPTSRMQNRPGMGHFEIAQSVVNLDPNTDLYQQMFALKYLRVGEDAASNTLYVDAPVSSADKLTTRQRRWLKDKQAEGWKVEFNNRSFVEARDTRATQVVKQLLG